MCGPDTKTIAAQQKRRWNETRLEDGVYISGTQLYLERDILLESITDLTNALIRASRDASHLLLTRERTKDQRRD